MSTIQNFIKRHYIKITSATALAVGLYKFAEYAVVDHSKGQSYPLAFMQNVYWLLQERLGILEQDKIPYKEEDISRETIQYCLRTGGIILPDSLFILNSLSSKYLISNEKPHNDCFKVIVFL